MIRLGAFDPDKDYSGKFCLMFRFRQNYDIPSAHCTHKYLGAVDKTTLQKAIAMVDDYFVENKSNLSAPRVWWFDKYSLFGKEKDTPALERTTQTDMLLDLLDDLNELVPSQWPSYRPHVTVTEMYEFMKLPLVPRAYCLTEGKITHGEWPMGSR